jgi:hypothetical protein
MQQSGDNYMLPMKMTIAKYSLSDDVALFHEDAERCTRTVRGENKHPSTWEGEKTDKIGQGRVSTIWCIH